MLTVCFIASLLFALLLMRLTVAIIFTNCKSVLRIKSTNKINKLYHFLFFTCHANVACTAGCHFL